MAAPVKRGGVRLLDIPGTAPTPLTYNMELESSGVVYTQALSGPLYSLDIQASGNYNIKMAFTDGEIELEKGWTVFAGGAYSREFNAPWPDLTIYVSTDYADDHGTGGELSRGAQILIWQDDNTTN